MLRYLSLWYPWSDYIMGYRTRSIHNIPPPVSVLLRDGYSSDPAGPFLGRSNASGVPALRPGWDLVPYELQVFLLDVDDREYFIILPVLADKIISFSESAGLLRPGARPGASGVDPRDPNVAASLVDSPHPASAFVVDFGRILL